MSVTSPFQDILDAIAKLIGGTLVSSSKPGFYSGAKVGDGTGVAGMQGCYSTPPDVLVKTPVGVVLPGSFQAGMEGPNQERNLDQLKLLILVSRHDPRGRYPNLTQFRDTIPAAFRTKMTLGLGTPNAAKVLQCYATAGRPIVQPWGVIDYWAWDFTLSLLRIPVVTYVT